MLLRGCSHLTFLDIAHNSLGPRTGVCRRTTVASKLPCVSSDMYRAYRSGLMLETSAVDRCLHVWHVLHAGEAIAGGLQSASHLEHLNISWNPLGQGIQHLAWALIAPRNGANNK